jgi:hypothetical protein
MAIYTFVESFPKLEIEKKVKVEIELELKLEIETKLNLTTKKTENLHYEKRRKQNDESPPIRIPSVSNKQYSDFSDDWFSYDVYEWPANFLEYYLDSVRRC